MEVIFGLIIFCTVFYALYKRQQCNALQNMIYTAAIFMEAVKKHVKSNSINDQVWKTQNDVVKAMRETASFKI